MPSGSAGRGSGAGPPAAAAGAADRAGLRRPGQSVQQVQQGRQVRAVSLEQPPAGLAQGLVAPLPAPHPGQGRRRSRRSSVSASMRSGGRGSASQACPADRAGTRTRPRSGPVRRRAGQRRPRRGRRRPRHRAPRAQAAADRRSRTLAHPRPGPGPTSGRPRRPGAWPAAGAGQSATVTRPARGQVGQEGRLVEDRHAQLLRLVQLAAGLLAGDHGSGPLADAAGDLAAPGLDGLLGRGRGSWPPGCRSARRCLPAKKPVGHRGAGRRRRQLLLVQEEAHRPQIAPSGAARRRCPGSRPPPGPRWDRCPAGRPAAPAVAAEQRRRRCRSGAARVRAVLTPTWGMPRAKILAAQGRCGAGPGRPAGGRPTSRPSPAAPPAASRSRRNRSAGPATRPCSRKRSMERPPSPSMSQASRPTKWRSRPARTAGQRGLTQRRATSSSTLHRRRGRRRDTPSGRGTAVSVPVRCSGHHPQHLGDDVAALDHHHRVADPDVLALHLLPVVQGGPADGGAGQQHRLAVRPPA